ncbi:MAG: flippase [Bacteroidetes bacterium]|nr:MAG: flippase [Bacteroidota bacterium]
MNLFKNKIKGDIRVIASNFMSLTILQAANYILPLIVLPFLVRILGTDKFGLVMFAQAMITFFNVIVDFGFNISGTREISLAREDKKKLSELFSSILLIKSGLIILGFILLIIIVELFTRFKIDAEVYYLSFGVVIGQALFPVWFFQGIEKMKFVTLINILAKVIFTVLIFLVIRNKEDYLLVPVFNSLGFIVAGLIGLIISLKHVNYTKPKWNMVKKLFLESFSLFVSNFAVNLYTTCNVFILGIFTGNTIVGVYSSMEKLILAMKNIYVPLYQALFPWLAKQGQEKQNKTIKKLAPIVLGVGSLITLTIALFGKTILFIIYNDELIGSYTIIFKILSFIAIFAALSMLYNTLYLPAIKKFKTRMIILITGGLINVLLNLFLVRLYGIYGTAFSVVSTELILVILGFYYFKKYSKT